MGELAVEGFEGLQVELADEELIADAAEEAFDFAAVAAASRTAVWRWRPRARRGRRVSVISWQQ